MAIAIQWKMNATCLNTFQAETQFQLKNLTRIGSIGKSMFPHITFRVD